MNPCRRSVKSTFEFSTKDDKQEINSDGTESEIPVKQVHVNDLRRVSRPGEKIAVDGKVTDVS